MCGGREESRQWSNWVKLNEESVFVEGRKDIKERDVLMLREHFEGRRGRFREGKVSFEKEGKTG